VQSLSEREGQRKTDSEGGTVCVCMVCVRERGKGLEKEGGRREVYCVCEKERVGERKRVRDIHSDRWRGRGRQIVLDRGSVREKEKRRKKKRKRERERNANTDAALHTPKDS
jgi:hypothetical protein